MNSWTDLLCFRMGSLQRRIMRYYNNRFSEFGITVGQSFVLFHLMEHDGCSVKDIANAVQLDSPAVTGLVDRMLKEGLVVRKEDPDDRRSVQVFITPKGREIAVEAGKIAIEFNKHLNESLAGDAVKFDYSLAVIEHELKTRFES
ncbi:MAG: MarR family winged helix-turn-helix transcriptional regulator [Candidatus Saccharibacteria bacterium]